MQSSVRNGQRWSTAKAYLRPVMERENLHISIKSLVTKVKQFSTDLTNKPFVYQK